MHIIERTIADFLSKAAAGNNPYNEALVDAYLQDMKTQLIRTFHSGEQEPFRLRMSNIGKDLRQLWLEKTHGKNKDEDPSWLLKMFAGHSQEQAFTYIVKAAGLDIRTNDLVEIDINGTKIKGELDWVLECEGKVYDVKTASDYSYHNKFVNYETLAKDDSFGYVDQLIGYSIGAKKEPGGWVVIHKSPKYRYPFNRLYDIVKVVPYPYSLAEVESGFRMRIAKKIERLEKNDVPPCPGLEKEVRYNKATGNTIIGKQCIFCTNPKKCHPGAKLEESRVSTAKEKPMVYYVD
jgi:hypothetical protein